MNLKIKFSHRYVKLNYAITKIANQGYCHATLLHATQAVCHMLHESFIDYDTVYFDGTVRKNYSLPNGLVIILLFEIDGNLFTTIRRHSPRKYSFYTENAGKEFEVVIE